MKNRKKDRNGKLKLVETKRNRDNKLDDAVDALFRLPLADFTGARNTLAASLKKSGHGDEAFLVKALVKPSISAWAVNQLYWNYGDAFDGLVASGERFHKAQASPGAGKLANLREALDARREVLDHLSDLATSLLQEAGHNPSLETIRRITTTLEAMSVYASRPDAPRPGRLTHDVDPPGFDSLASFVPGARVQKPAEKSERMDLNRGSQKSSPVVTGTRPKSEPDDKVRRQLEDARKATIAAAKVAVQDARRSLTEARSRAQGLESTQKKVSVEARKAEKLRREAEERLKEARAFAEDAVRREKSVALEAKEAASAAENAQRTVERATKELESLFRETPGK
jgi:hypothetical protein